MYKKGPGKVGVYVHCVLEACCLMVHAAHRTKGGEPAWCAAINHPIKRCSNIIIHYITMTSTMNIMEPAWSLELH